MIATATLDQERRFPRLADAGRPGRHRPARALARIVTTGQGPDPARHRPGGTA